MGFDSDQTFFCTQNGTLVGKLDKNSEESISSLRDENSQYQKLDRSTLMAILAARKLKLTSKDVAINIGSSRGATTIWEDFHAEFIKTGQVPVQTSPLTTLGNVSSWVAQDLGTESTAFSHSITCATAAHSILNAIAWLESGMATSFIAGGTEAPLTDFTIAQMKALRIYSKENGEYPCQALDLNKSSNQMILGEAVACMLLSKEPSQNGIKITDYGTAIEQLKSATSMSSQGLGFQKSMKQAIGKISLEEIDAVITHAPGTFQGDASEMAAITSVFGKVYPRLFNNKWQLGHSLGASAAVNIYMAMQLLNGESVSQIPYMSDQVMNPRGNVAQPSKILINASGFGGNCVSILIEKEN